MREGRGSIPSLAQRCRRILRFHDATLSRAGIRSGHRIVKWFKASLQLWIGIVHFLAACRNRQVQQLQRRLLVGERARVLMILRIDAVQRLDALVV